MSPAAPGTRTGTGSPSVREALAQAAALGLDRIDAHALLGHALQRPRAWLIAHDADPLPPEAARAFATACHQRADGVPVAYLLGEREFHGLALQVTPDVLVPRPDTETLVDWALALLPALGAAPRVLDLGTGSGAIALAVAHRHPAAQVLATDLSPAALAVAQGNAQRLGLPVAWAQGTWWQAVAAGACFDLVLSNPPYIAGDDPHLPALRHEPRLALTPGGDGLDAYRAIVAGAAAHLAPGGWLLFEHGFDQAAPVAALLQAAGLTEISTRLDLEARPRCTGGRAPSGKA
ncbi:peptide chain release factor N(5)-glutamine methyltransferase [Aquabacterium sp. OR-4]|uniref:peptide chain release factor N(5)-glutamine methyltransferase n=1 Tax=Aquabacterium sp. OR-4 TaxID=2978127 RepID=UPI0021B38409|nr:peptide chain release factor N(5)-glutamine methyltransferase [Aquabacterium sp. OR-4]MDT7837511.1 peptide chain release factor N(5)-glutamine methyltransferase [Aquabacterium sp. OR-4]